MAISPDSNSYKLTVYLPGRLLTGSEFVDFFQILESALVWSRIVIGQEEDHEIYGYDNWYAAIRSFDKFLANKYGRLLENVITQARQLDVRRSVFSKLRYNKAIDTETYVKILENLDASFKPPGNVYSQSLRRLGFRGVDFNVGDLHEWISSEYGHNLLEVKSVDPSGSIEFVFDLAAYMSIVMLAEYPTVKDSIVYACGMLRSYIGIKKQPPLRKLELPKLTPSMLRFLGQYDDVELKADSMSGKLEFKLKRDSNEE